VLGIELPAAAKFLDWNPNNNEVIIHDEIHADTPADVWWFMHTGAKIFIS